MASVFVGKHRVLPTRVAIKVLQERYLDNAAITKRFFNEAQVIASIGHPNIVEIYDYGRLEDGSAYIVMELLSGESLRDRIRQGPIPERQAIRFARQLASALAEAHRQSVVHRDLKPDNVFIIEDAEVESGERIKLLDFGVAKKLEGEKVTEETAMGVLVGTPAYMSPEQCKGFGDVDGRSDIYSLGVLLYRMVTNRLPFEAEATGELIGKHIYSPPPPVRALRPEVSAELEQVILRCLAKSPGDRFQTMDDLAAALDELTGHTGSAVRRLPSADPAPRRHPSADPAPSGRGDPDPVSVLATIEEIAPSSTASLSGPTAIASERAASGEPRGFRKGWLALGCGLGLAAGAFVLGLGSGESGERPATASPPAAVVAPGEAEPSLIEADETDFPGDEGIEAIDPGETTGAAAVASEEVTEERDSPERQRTERRERRRSSEHRNARAESADTDAKKPADAKGEDAKDAKDAKGDDVPMFF
jgi:serine/threonine protein kinase